MDELSTRFQKYYPENTIFVSWIKDIQEMCVIDFEHSRKDRGGQVVYQKKNGKQPHESSAVTSVSATVSSRRPALAATAKKAVKYSAAKSRFDRTTVYKRAMQKSRTLYYKNLQSYEPLPGDKFFIPWGEWWDQNWLNKTEAYAAAGVNIYPICHDILPMIVPQFSGNSSSLADFVSQIFPISKTVITPSHSTKNDLSEWMKANGLTVPSISVFGLGEDFAITDAVLSDEFMTEKYDITKEQYLMYVSTVEPRKNHTLLYYTYKLAKSRGITLPKLLIIGRVGHDTSELIKFIKQDPEIQDTLHICDFVSDDELNWLYQNCMFTVMPSFYEGWGIPVIETIARGKPAVCSDRSSLREISDDFVLRFNPASTDECLNAITKMTQPKVLNEYKKRVASYKPHPWDESFKEVIHILGDK